MGNCVDVGFCFSNRDFATASVPTLFFFLLRKKKGKKKELQGDAPLTPAVSSDTTTACGSSGEDSVQTAQRGQIKVQIIKRPAANYPWLPLEGKLSASAD